MCSAIIQIFNIIKHHILPVDGLGFSQGPPRGGNFLFSWINPVTASGGPEDQPARATRTFRFGLRGKNSTQSLTPLKRGKTIPCCILKMNSTKTFDLVIRRRFRTWLSGRSKEARVHHLIIIVDSVALHSCDHTSPT